MSSEHSSSYRRAHDGDRDARSYSSHHSSSLQRSRRRSASPSPDRHRSTSSNDKDYHAKSHYDYNRESERGYDRRGERGQERRDYHERDRRQDSQYNRERRDERNFNRDGEYGYERDYTHGYARERDFDRSHDINYERRDAARYHDDRHSKRTGHDPPPLKRYPDQQSSEPNINIVLRGLPEDAQEHDIEKKLQSMGASVDNVALIRCRDTGESRKFAFVRFASVGHAIQFHDEFFGFYMNSHRVRIDYCNKEEGDEEQQEWRCAHCDKFNSEYRRTCIDCRAPFENDRSLQRSTTTESLEINDGAKDVSSQPSNMILLRCIDNLWTEESIYNAMKHMDGLKRVFLIRDKATGMSCEFAFAEFETLQLAASIISKDNQCVIGGQKVTVSFADPGTSFLPVYTSSKWATRADRPGSMWIYRDDQSYACEHSPSILAERAREADLEKKEAEDKKKQKEEKAKEQEKMKDTLESDVSAFYADMGDILSNVKGDDDDDETSDIFSLPGRK